MAPPLISHRFKHQVPDICSTNAKTKQQRTVPFAERGVHIINRLVFSTNNIKSYLLLLSSKSIHTMQDIVHKYKKNV